MTTANGVVDTVVAAGLTREYVENPFEFMGNVRAKTNPVTGVIETLNTEVRFSTRPRPMESAPF